MCNDLKLKLLGSMPLDPRLARACDEGKDFLVDETAQSPAAQALASIVNSKLFYICFNAI